MSGVSVLGVDRGPIHGIAPGAWVIVVQGLRHRGLLRRPTRQPPSRRRSSTASTSSTSRSPAAPTRSPTRSSWPSSTPTPPACSSPPRPATTGPGAGTANHLSPWVTTVAASTQTREFASTLTVTATDGATFTADGASITGGAGPLPLVLPSAAPYTDPLCDAPAPPGIFTGKIVACQRGGNAPRRQGLQRPAGRRRRDDALQPDPRRHRDRQPLAADRAPRRRHRASSPSWRATRASPRSFTAGAPRNGQGDVMAAFSSRGPGRAVHQARRDRAGCADPRRPHPDRRDASTAGPPGELLPGHRRHVDVVAARRRRRAPAQRRCTRRGRRVRSSRP